MNQSHWKVNLCLDLSAGEGGFHSERKSAASKLAETGMIMENKISLTTRKS